MIVKTFSKEPTWIAPYVIDWSDWLGSRVILTSVWSLPSGITNDGDTNDDTIARILLSGGTWTEEYIVTNTITATGGASESRSILIKIQQAVAYCTVEECQAQAQGMSDQGIPRADDDFIRALIERASRMIDREVGVSEGYFNPPLYPMATERIFYGDGTSFLKLDPYIAGSLNTTLSMPDGYTVPSFIEHGGYLIPTSATGIRPRVFTNWGYGAWETGVPITVTAQWGFQFTPADINIATIEMVINLWREIDPASAKLVGIEGSILRENLPPRVKEILKFHRISSARSPLV